MPGDASYSISDLRAIADAGVSLTSELTLEAVLQKLVDLASKLVNTRYAAMSVVGKDGGIEQFIFTGISQAERHRIGNLPQGRGLLGVLLQDGTSLRLDDMSLDPRSVGFPPNHPPMRSLLGVPLVRRGTIIGNLYLSDKVDGAAFTDRDEEIVRVLAAQAAAAIDNAELFQSEYRLAQESKALLQLGRQVTSLDVTQLLDSVTGHARNLLETDVAAVMLLGHDETLSIASDVGTISVNETGGKRRLGDHHLQQLALDSMEPVVVLDATADERLRSEVSFVGDERLVSVICLPLRGKQGPLGTLTVGHRRKTWFDQRAVELLEAIANYAAVAIETSRLQQQLESLARLEERERIAMDLHDGVIQSVYAVSLHLEDASLRLDESPAEVRATLEKSMDDLHQVIKDIRSYIFDLRPRVSDVEDLPEALRLLSDEMRVNTVMTVAADIPASMNSSLNAAQTLALYHIAQECLNNVSKHSEATQVSVRLLAEENDRVLLEIEDNGRGFHLTSDTSGQRHGMRNMKDRARAVNANLFVDSEPGRGTIIRVEVPLK